VSDTDSRRSDAASGSSRLDRLTDPATRPNPWPLYAEMREEPARREPDGTWVVARYADVAALLRHPAMSADPASAGRESQPLSFLNMDPPDHDRLRRIANQHFRPRGEAGGVPAIRASLEARVKALIDTLAAREEVDIVADLAYPFPVGVIADLLGVPRADEPQFHAWAEAILQAPERQVSGRRSPTAEAAFQALAAYMFSLIEARRDDPREDMLSRLVHDDAPDGKMTTPQIIAVAVLLLLAGHETTVNLIANGMLTLLRHPAALARLAREPRWATMVVEETLRYEPPVHFTFRTTLETVEIGGASLPPRADVQLMLAAANRDPTRFERPDVFDPDRTNNQHLGFGTGIHTCFGAPLARLEGQIALSELARRLIAPRLLQDPPPYRYNPTLRGPRELKLAIAGVRD